jgi:hypothetical protein
MLTHCLGLNSESVQMPGYLNSSTSPTTPSHAQCCSKGWLRPGMTVDFISINVPDDGSCELTLPQDLQVLLPSLMPAPHLGQSLW